MYSSKEKLSDVKLEPTTRLKKESDLYSVRPLISTANWACRKCPNFGNSQNYLRAFLRLHMERYFTPSGDTYSTSPCRLFWFFRNFVIRTNPKKVEESGLIVTNCCSPLLSGAKYITCIFISSKLLLKKDASKTKP